ncbi:MAG TPA: hypothetical protein VFJ59_05405 [Pseudolabrys sp.]|nr:hypothetical protein [Pseudolabrys sp.]
MRQWDVGTTRNITPGGINGSEGIVSKKLDALYRWPFQELDQSEESEGTGGYAYYYYG